jgi:hypothetical protein
LSFANAPSTAHRTRGSGSAARPRDPVGYLGVAYLAEHLDCGPAHLRGGIVQCLEQLRHARRTDLDQRRACSDLSNGVVVVADDVVVAAEAAVQSKQVEQSRDRARITNRYDREQGGTPDCGCVGAGRLLDEQGCRLRSSELAERVRRIDPYVLIGIVPEDGLQRLYGSRMIRGAPERTDSPRALVPVGVLQPFDHVILSCLTRDQRGEQETDLNGSLPNHASPDPARCSP